MKAYTLTWLADPRLPVSWESIPSVAIDCFPWYKAGEKQKTKAQAVVSELNLHLRFLCEDKHIYARYTQPNDPVSQDSCVEMFFIPEPGKNQLYFNLEINCCGTILLGYGAGRESSKKVPEEIIRAIRVKHSVPGPVKEESQEDKGWEVEAIVPFEALRTVAPFERPAPGAVWRGNFYRCGGITDPQFASWMPIDLPKPEYHCPQFFGLLEIR